MNSILIEAIKPLVKKNLKHLDVFLSNLEKVESERHKENGKEGTFSMLLTMQEGVSYMVPVMIQDEKIEQVDFLFKGVLKNSISLNTLILNILDNA